MPGWWPRDSRWLGSRGGREGSSAVRSRSSSLWPPALSFGHCVGAGRLPLWCFVDVRGGMWRCLVGEVWCGRLHLRVMRLMPAVRAEPSGRWWWQRTHRLVLLPMRSTGGRRRGGLPICLIKVADLRFLLCEDGDLSDAGPS
jgi:hypothetical protein